MINGIDEVHKPIIFEGLSAEEFRNHPVWIAELTNGIKAHHKPHRRSWLELKEWLKINPDVFIHHLYFRFRDNYISIARDKSGYFFSQGAQCRLEEGAITQQLFIGGYLDGDRIVRKRFIMPELIEADPPEDVYPHDHIEMQRGLIRSEK